MLKVIFLVALLVGSADRQAPPPPQSCRGLEARLRVTPATLQRGTKPRFAVVLKNVSQKPVRLLDVRDGRRPDLAESYYQIIVEQNGRALRDLPQAISDPGPIQAADFFFLVPGASIETTISTTADLSAVPAGSYSAYVRITIDPFGGPAPKCHSARTPFNVRS